MLVPPESLSAVIVMISSKSVSICNIEIITMISMICNHSRARLVDSSRNRVFKGVPRFDALVRRTP